MFFDGSIFMTRRQTAFLASMDGQMFSLTALNTQIGLPLSDTSRQIIYSCLAGALIFHICASGCLSCRHVRYLIP